MIIKIEKRGDLIFTLIFLIFIQLSAIAQQQEIDKMKKVLIAKIDSCNNNLLQLDQDQKIEILQLASATDEHTLLSSFFKQKKMYGDEYAVLMRKAMTENSLDSVYLYYNMANNYYRNDENNAKQLIWFLQNNFISWCTINNYSELAINALQQQIEYNSVNELGENLSIYLSLMANYGNSGKYTQAIESGKTALRQQQQNIPNHSLDLQKTMICHLIAENYYILGDYQNSLAYIDSSFVYIKNIPDKFDPEYASNIHNLALIDSYSMKSVCYSSLKDFKQASLMLNKVESLFSKNKTLTTLKPVADEFLAQKNWTYIVYNYQKSDYNNALRYLNESKQLNLKPALFAEYKNLAKWEARILEKMGKYEQAYLILKEQQHETDSINKINSTKEINAIWAVFEVNKAQQAKEKSELKTKNIAITTSIIISIALMVIIYFIVTNKRLKAKNMILFRQQKDLLSSQTAILTKKKDVLPKEYSEISQQEVLHYNAEQALYVEIIEYLKTSKKYTNPDISRDSIAKELGTNRQYIIDAISNNTRMSFNEFINNFRIDHARDLLLNEDNIMIKKVYTDSGFISRSTFSILFKEKFGMTPSEFRDCANQEPSIK
jgi:AraC-like DNA-binding protein